VEHKGIPYQVVQTASPTGFRWTVQLASNRTKTGTSSSKGNAIFQAVCAIDKAIRVSTKLRPRRYPLEIQGHGRRQIRQ
jgi:hypothetical protein